MSARIGTVTIAVFTVAALSFGDDLTVNQAPTLEQAQAFADSADPKKPRCGHPYIYQGIMLFTTLCSIESASIKAKEKYDSLTLTEESLAEYAIQGLKVNVLPKGASRSSSPSNYEMVVLKSTDGSQVVKPTDIKLLPVTYGNKLGYSAEFQAVEAVFSWDDIARLRSLDKKGEWEVVAVRSTGTENKVTVKEKHFKLLH